MQLLSKNIFLKESADIADIKYVDTIINDNMTDTLNNSKIKEFLLSKLSYIKSLPSKIKVYRILDLKDRNNINTDQLGSHFTLEPNFSDEFLISIGLNPSHKENFTLVSAVTDKSNILLSRTLSQNAIFPQENEIFIKNNSFLRILK